MNPPMGVEVVQLIVLRRSEEGELYGGAVSRWKKLDALFPVAEGGGFAWGELAELSEAVKGAAVVEEGAVGEELGGGAPRVGEDGDGDGAELICFEVEEGGVGVAVALEDGVVGGRGGSGPWEGAFWWGRCRCREF
ncbi:glyoxal oxidase-related protein [Actinidia rufa]|uniref:Glyoxal oxidase-related protein n=1 Tax=Actinidia rufa TaxID=165716 RepID=A0A7J0EB08_9ERIC|nr:glyoxal oxidase-related protein [Actinidia rufa]